MLDDMADPDKIGDLEDPRQMAQWMKKMGREMGEEVLHNYTEVKAVTIAL